MPFFKISIVAFSLFCAGVAHASSPAVAAGALPASVSVAQKPDLFSADKWHALAPSWPGVMTFDAVTKQVTLAPFGSSPIVVAYTYKVSPKKAKEKSIRGSMTFTRPTLEKSVMAFTLVNQAELTLEFKGGQRREVYQRMSPAEVQAYEQKIREMMGVEKGFAPIP